MSNLHPIFEELMPMCMPFPVRPPAALPSANISYGGADWQVTYDYTPPEAQTFDHPGSPAEVQICEVYLLNHPEHTDLKDLLGEHVISDMENKILESLGDY